MSVALNATRQALYNALSGGTALVSALGGTAIYSAQAPDGAALPYIVYSLQAGGQEYAPGTLENHLWYVRAYAAGEKTAGDLYALADALLDGQTLTVTGWRNFATRRIEDISLPEETPNGRVYSAGGIYRIRLT